MKYDKLYLRNKSLLQRKKKYLTVKKFNFNLIFKLIRKHFHKKKNSYCWILSIKLRGKYPKFS